MLFLVNVAFRVEFSPGEGSEAEKSYTLYFALILSHSCFTKENMVPVCHDLDILEMKSDHI